ncbi:MAG: transposase [Muribaculaceae bacterium]
MKIGQTTKQKLYLEEVLRLHREKGYGEDRISRIIPIGHTTVSRWITKFATANQQNLVQMRKKESRVKEVVTLEEKDLKALKGENARFQAQLRQAQLRADFYDEMINVAEAKFNISIRKKAGTKQ